MKGLVERKDWEGVQKIISIRGKWKEKKEKKTENR